MLRKEERKDGRTEGRTDGSVTISLRNLVSEGEKISNTNPLKTAGELMYFGRVTVLTLSDAPVMLVLLQPRWHKLSYSHFCIYFVAYILHAFISYHHLARCARYNIFWSSLSVTFGRSVALSGYSSFLRCKNWLPLYNWNIVESGVNHHNPIISNF
jgi:hypothetical protein